MPIYSIAKAKSQLAKLIDEALAGQTVTIARRGKPIVELRPSAAVPKPMTKADIEWLRRRRGQRPPLGGDAVTVIRAMRDEER